MTYLQIGLNRMSLTIMIFMGTRFTLLCAITTLFYNFCLPFFHIRLTASPFLCLFVWVFVCVYVCLSLSGTLHVCCLCLCDVIYIFPHFVCQHKSHIAFQLIFRNREMHTNQFTCGAFWNVVSIRYHSFWTRRISFFALSLLPIECWCECALLVMRMFLK